MPAQKSQEAASGAAGEPTGASEALPPTQETDEDLVEVFYIDLHIRTAFDITLAGEVTRQSLTNAEQGVIGFIPVFRSRLEAEAFAGGPQFVTSIIRR